MDKVRHRLRILRNRTPQLVVGQICALHLAIPRSFCLICSRLCADRAKNRLISAAGDARSESQNLEDRLEPEHCDADRPRGLYGARVPFHLDEAAALRRSCEFGGSDLLALQLVSGVARSRPNRNFYINDLHHAYSAVRRGQLLALSAMVDRGGAGVL